MRVNKAIQLFPQTDKDLRHEYEELGEIEEFRILSQREMNFVWYFANSSSPYYVLPEKDRLMKCLELMKGELTDEKLEAYYDMRFPKNVASAIDRMRKFDPKLRIQAKAITIKIFNNIKRIVNINPDSIVDMEEKKKYVSMSLDIMKSMPDLVRQLEMGFGVREKKKKSDSSTADQSTWDAIMNEE